MRRRQFLKAGSLLTGLALSAPALSRQILSPGHRLIPQRPNCRVIVDNDFAGDPDGLIALAHQLLSPKSHVPLITSTPLPDKFRGSVPPGISAARGRDIAMALCAKIDGGSKAGIMAGPESFAVGEADAAPAARAIVAEAMRDDPLPLYLSCGGPLTNVAAALRLEPAIARRMTIIWIGGGDYPDGGWEYNLATDVEAARQVIERSKTPLWQVPQSSYRQMQQSVAELRVRLRSISPLGAWLYEKFTSPPDFVDIGGTWPMGDSPPVLLTAISQESGRRTIRKARRIAAADRYGDEMPDREITVFETMDARLIMEDFFAKLHIAANPGL